MRTVDAVQLLGLLVATVLAPLVEITGVLATFVTVGGGIGGAFALIQGRPGAEIGVEAARGAAAGFIIGIPATVAAAILVALV